MAYTTSQARQELLDTVAQAANELGFASACLAEAYEQLDEYNGDRLEAECFRPVQMAYGRAKRTHSEFAARHGLRAAAFEPQPTASGASRLACSCGRRARQGQGVASPWWVGTALLLFVGDREVLAPSPPAGRVR